MQQCARQCSLRNLSVTEKPQVRRNVHRRRRDYRSAVRTLCDFESSGTNSSTARRYGERFLIAARARAADNRIFPGPELPPLHCRIRCLEIQDEATPAHPALRAAVGRAIVEGASSRLSSGEGARTGALLGS